MVEVQGKKIINNMQIETSSGTVYWQEDEPTNPKDGDTWFKVVNGKATNAYNRETDVWVEVAFESSIIAENITGKIITGGEINGSHIKGSEIEAGSFINTFDAPDGDLFNRKGEMRLQGGSFTQTTSLTRTQENDSLAMTNNFKLQGAQLRSEATVFAQDGKTVNNTSLAQLQGGSLNLLYSDNSGSYYGTLDAKTLQMFTVPKKREVKIPDSQWLNNGLIRYTRIGPFVVANIEFNGLKSGAWQSVAPLEKGYTPNGGGRQYFVIGNNSYQGTFATIYTSGVDWRIIMSKTTDGTGNFGGNMVYLTTDDWNLA